MKKCALLIVDVQNLLVDEKPYHLEETLLNIKTLLETCRENNMEVIYVQHEEDEGLVPNTYAWEIHESIKPNSGEKIFHKRFSSSFRKTELEAYLTERNIGQLILVGMQTELCIDTTCRVAFEKGYELFMPEHTNTTFDNDLLSGSEIYHFHNFNIFKDRFAKVQSVKTVEMMIKALNA